MIQKKWKNLRLQNQIWIIQGLVIATIFSILLLLSFELVNRFSVFIQNELFKTLILKSMVNTIQLTTQRVNQVKYFEYLTQYIDRRSLEHLYFFYDYYDIQINSSVEECLQSQYSEQFYSVQFCYGIFGQLSNLTDLRQIKDLIGLQSLFLPLNQNRLQQTYYIIQLDDSQFLSQYKGEYLTSLDQDLLDVFYYMTFYEIPGYYKEIKRNNQSMQLVFNTIPGTKIAAGALYNNNKDEFNKISQQDRYFNQRQLYVFESGELIYDTIDSDTQGQMFQNVSLMGFDEIQFQKIKNFTNESLSVTSECEFYVPDQYLCLVDQRGQPKIIKVERFGEGEFKLYYIILLDARSSVKTIQEFYQKLQNSINQLILNISIYLLLTLIISFILQMVFIKKLNKPLKDLQDIAKFHINNEQYNILTGLRVIQQQNQIQKLADAFFNLININQISKNKEAIIKVNQQKKIQHLQGMVQKRYKQVILNEIRQQILRLVCYD
ncbi:hypothetical protein pb186bvf_004996 [Paramecium bursaria]